MQSIVSGRRRTKASLADVARKVGVSTSTASRALTRPEMVRPQVVERVRRVAQELGYVANPFARSLRVQESKTLGLIVPDSTNPFFAEVARGIEAACFRAGYTLILCNSDRSLEKEASQARVLAEKRVDGVLLFNISDDSAPTIAWLQAIGVPVVLVERSLPALPPAGVQGAGGVDCVVSDNRAGVRRALEHLAALGHRRVACLAGDLRASQYAARVAAYQEAVPALGLEAHPALVRAGLVTYADGQRAAQELLLLSRAPTALLCTTDTLAIGALRGAAVLGRRVPEEVAVVGYGNTELTAFTNPPLTSVGQQRLAVGARAVRLVLRRLAQRAAGRRPEARTYVVPTRLVVRESTVGTAGNGASRQTTPSAESAQTAGAAGTAGTAGKEGQHAG
ncbi:MAG TPA: LacI family DNA-binding transcriptional regulator [Chloroflexota bacterium]|nr:LacI family DNA-binding transcriptional regulator [Chloroflexota bacterium]